MIQPTLLATILHWILGLYLNRPISSVLDLDSPPLSANIEFDLLLLANHCTGKISFWWLGDREHLLRWHGEE